MNQNGHATLQLKLLGKTAYSVLHKTAAAAVLLLITAALAPAQESGPQPPPSPPASRPACTPQDFPGDARSGDAAKGTSHDIAPHTNHELPPDARPADGRRASGVPLETYAVAPGTKFLVRLEKDLGTKGAEQNQTFRVRTLEPLEAGSGIYLPSGAEILGHISRVEPAGVTGRAKLWLTFDELRARFGPLPIVAEVVSVPGDHSLKALREGLIEGERSTQHDAAIAAAAGAAIGAVDGVKHKDKKEAAAGAAMGAITAYLTESGRGREINLPKGAKLQLELERALYLVKR